MLAEKQLMEELKNPQKDNEDSFEDSDTKAGKTKYSTDEDKLINTEKLLQEQQKQMKGGIKDKDMQEALRIAHEAERAEEEELIRKAIEESSKLEE